MLIFYAEFMLNNSEAKRSLRFFETNPSANRSGFNFLRCEAKLKTDVDLNKLA